MEDLLCLPHFVTTRNIMMEVLQRQPLVIESMPDHLKDDQEIFRSVLKNNSLPSNLMQCFSRGIRSNAALMLALFQHSDCRLSWMGDFSERLRDDKEFFTSAVDNFRNNSSQHAHTRKLVLRISTDKTESQVLKYASERLRSDFDVVMSCVRLSGMNLEHASDDLRRNEKIVLAACAHNMEASRYCLPVGFETGLMLRHKDFAGTILREASAETLKLCLSKYGDDEDFCMLAICNENLEWSMIPEAFRFDTNFVAKAAEFFAWLLWEALPRDMKRNFQIASVLVKRKEITVEMKWDVVDNCPEVLSDRNLLLELMAHNFYRRDFCYYVIENSTIDIQHDKGFMVHAIKHNPHLWEYCSDDLKGDREILIAVAECGYNSLDIVPNTYQLEHPEFVACAIRQHMKGLFFMQYFSRGIIYHSIRREMWHNQAIAMAWLESGGVWTPEIPPHFADDRELILTRTKYTWNDFESASKRLKNDKAFVLEALAIDARIIRYAAYELLFDHEIMIAAFSRDVRAITQHANGTDYLFASLVSFARKIRERLRESRAFQNEFMGSAKCSSPDNADCILPMLNQGPEMLGTYEEKIASFAGILHKKEELERYEATSRHLAAWGI